MSESGVEIVRRLFERFSAGGIEAALPLIHEDVVVVVPPSMSAEPDTYRGHDGMRRYFEAFEGMLTDVRYEADAIEEEGGYVLAHVRLGGRGASSEIPVEIAAFVVHTLEDGRVKRLDPYPDLDEAREAIASR